MIKLGQEKKDECEFEEAIEFFNQALQNNPDDFDTLISRGMAKGQLDMHEDAIRDYTAALAIDPKNKDALFARAGANCILGRLTTKFTVPETLSMLKKIKVTVFKDGTRIPNEIPKKFQDLLAELDIELKQM